MDATCVVKAWKRALFAGAVLLLAGCSRVTTDNYAKVEVGMPRAEVYGILGKPDEVSGGALGPLSFSTETWKGRSQTINISFGGDRVALKAIGQNASN